MLESQSYDVICAVGVFSARGLGCCCHSWRMDALRKGRDVIIVDPWMLWGKDEVWVVDIMVDMAWVNWRAD